MTEKKDPGGRPRGFTPGPLKRTTQIGVWRWNQELLESKIDRTSTPDGCYEWQGARTQNGPLFGVAKNDHCQMTPVRRLVWMLHSGTDIQEYSVHSTCGNINCLRIEHLALGRNGRYKK